MTFLIIFIICLFQPPVAKSPYPMDEIQQAIFNNAGCTQGQNIGDEDCLSLSIYTPYVNINSYWLHNLKKSIGWNLRDENCI